MANSSKQRSPQRISQFLARMASWRTRMRQNQGLGKRWASATEESYNGSTSEKTHDSIASWGIFGILMNSSLTFP
jgi:hypothetical protein